MRRVLTLFATVVLLWALLAQLNDTLSRTHVYIHAGALFVVFAALTQPLGSGLSVALLAGLMCDANVPVSFGTHLILFTATHLVVFRVRGRLPRNDTGARMIVAVLANAGLFAAFALLQLIRSPLAVAVWPRLFVDFVCSQALVGLAAPWFFALQERALALAGVDRHSAA